MCLKKITILLLAFYLVGCSHQEHYEWKDINLKSKIEDYFIFALVYPDPTQIDSLYNFIGEKLISENISILTLKYTGTDNFRDSSHFRLCAYKPFEDPGNVHFRNAFEIILSEQDSIYYAGHYDRIEYLNLALDEFLLNPNNLNTLSEKRMIDTKYLGKVEVSRGMIGIRWTSYKNDLSNAEYLSKYFKAYEYVKDYYTSRREILSEKYFGKPYKRLKKEKQEDICLINDMLIWFIFQ